MLAEILVKTHELAEKERGQQKRHGEPRGIDGQKEHAARDGVAGRGQYEHCGKDRADAGRPAEGEAEKEAAKDAGLRISVANAHVLIQPASQKRPKEADDGEREEMHGPKAKEKRPAVKKRRDAQGHQNHAENDPGAHVHFDQAAQKMKTKEQDQRPGYGRKQMLVLKQETADSAGGSPEPDKHHGEAGDERERGR